ncbi:hypothetical protein ACFSM5_14545 [Lacibacterium aquatile]|uniref:Uncharacterized protein n=1 Tax=Lacibacterium aquatile TaxID=1168082 RepID=A0ABW5DSQ6_9PROT
MRKMTVLGLGLASALLGSSPLRASTIGTVEMTCPYDGVKFTATLQMSGSSFGMMLDFRPFGAMTTPWPLAVCPTNGFVFYNQTIAPEELERLRPYVFSDDYRALQGEKPYFRAAHLAERAGLPRQQVTWLFV